MNWSVGTVLRITGTHDDQRRFTVKQRSFTTGEYRLTGDDGIDFWINLGAAQILLEPA